MDGFVDAGWLENSKIDGDALSFGLTCFSIIRQKMRRMSQDLRGSPFMHSPFTQRRSSRIGVDSRLAPKQLTLLAAGNRCPTN